MNVEFTRVGAASRSDRHGMFLLMDSHFENMREERFEQDLAEKDWIVLVKEHGLVVGFTTIRLSTAKLSTGDALIVYSGDTLVSPKCRMGTAFVRGWFSGMNHLMASHPGLNLYWFLLCSGFRTYRFMPVYWKTFFPRYDIPTPEAWQRDIDFLAVRQFGPEYDNQTGIVRFAHPQILKQAYRDIPPGRDAHPDIQFFSRRNPGHYLGDELVCLTRIHRDNLTPAGQRFWGDHNESFKVIGDEPGQ